MKLDRLKDNIILSGEKRKIDLIYGRFEDMHKLRGNLVFYQLEHPGYIDKEIDNLNLRKNLTRSVVGRCLKVAENLMILLPKCCNLNELADVFAECFEENNMFFVNF